MQTSSLVDQLLGTTTSSGLVPCTVYAIAERHHDGAIHTVHSAGLSMAAAVREWARLLTLMKLPHTHDTFTIVQVPGTLPAEVVKSFGDHAEWRHPNVRAPEYVVGVFERLLDLVEADEEYSTYDVVGLSPRVVYYTLDEARAKKDELNNEELGLIYNTEGDEMYQFILQKIKVVY